MPLWVGGGDINWCSHPGKQYGSSQKSYSRGSNASTILIEFRTQRTESRASKRWWVHSCRWQPLFTVAKRYKHPVSPSTWKQTSKTEREAHTALEQKRIPTLTTRRDHECVMLSETLVTARLMLHGSGHKLSEVESQRQEIGGCQGVGRREKERKLCLYRVSVLQDERIHV